MEGPDDPQAVRLSDDTPTSARKTKERAEVLAREEPSALHRTRLLRDINSPQTRSLVRFFLRTSRLLHGQTGVPVAGLGSRFQGDPRHTLVAG